ncbi:hypothetical protein M758_6G188200 [Ceratodon purpureus]|nr:hypothetical protein M758_6G188200 [Ceratodon purpureus]
MAEAGVDGAVIVQPINHKFDHSYVSSVLKMYPEKFVGMCLADPTEGGGGVKELERLIVKENFSGVRFNPYLWPSGQKMTNEVGKAMFAKAGELRVPVGFMCFKGLMLHVDEIEELCREFPRTTVLMDHLGFCKPPLTEEEAEAWNRLLNLSKYSQVHVKLSAFFRVSREPFPYNDTWPLLKQLLESYGAERLMWGSDFPFVVAECGYINSWQVLPTENSTDAFLTDEQLEWIMGGTALSVFQDGWRKFGMLPDSSDLGDEVLT